MKVVTVELDEYEARALAGVAGTLMAMMGDRLYDGVPLPEGKRVFPLESAQMKLEVALRSEGVEP